MKSAIFFILCATTAYARVAYIEEWEANDMKEGGARGVAEYGQIGNGTCILQFPGPLYWFHCENCDIVPSMSNSATGTYALSASNTAWQDVGQFTFVLNFLNTKFDERDVQLNCDATVNELTIYSFPSNTDQQSARTRIYERGIGRWDSYLVSFPSSVANFTVNSPNTFIAANPETYMIQNIQSWQTEVWFQFRYDGDWFTAADVSISHTSSSDDEEEEEEEESRRRRNAHF